MKYPKHIKWHEKFTMCYQYGVLYPIKFDEKPPLLRESVNTHDTTCVISTEPPGDIASKFAKQNKKIYKK